MLLVSDRSMQCFLRVSSEANHTCNTTKLTTVCPALTYSLPQWHVCFVGLFVFCLDVVGDHRMEAKGCQVPALPASHCQAADRQALEGHTPHPQYPQFAFMQHQSSLCCVAHSLLCFITKCRTGNTATLRSSEGNRKTMTDLLPAHCLRSTAKASKETNCGAVYLLMLLSHCSMLVHLCCLQTSQRPA